MDKWYCWWCDSDIRSEVKVYPSYPLSNKVKYCKGPAHRYLEKWLEEEKDNDPVLMQTKDSLFVVNPETGKIERKEKPIRKVVKKKRIKIRKPLNTPAVLGKE